MSSSALASPSGFATRSRSLLGLALLALALPTFAVRAWSSAYADALGNRIAAWLIEVLPPPAPAWEEAVPGAPAELEAPPANAQDVRAAFDAKRPRLHGRAAPVSGVRISSAQVLALAARRAMPTASFVKANAQRPAGLLLSGVSALGVGMQDGDVLTEAAGQKASSVAQVVGLVLSARARHEGEISGRFYRGGVPFLLTVEQPYPKGPVPG